MDVEINKLCFIYTVENIIFKNNTDTCDNNVINIDTCDNLGELQKY